MTYEIEKINGEVVYQKEYLNLLESLGDGKKLYIEVMTPTTFITLNMKRYYWGYLLPLYLDSFSTTRDAHQTFGEMFLERKEKIDIKLLGNIRNVLEYTAQYANVFRSQNSYKLIKDYDNDCFYFVYYLSISKLTNKQMLNYFKDIENSEASQNITVERFDRNKKYG